MRKLKPSSNHSFNENEIEILLGVAVEDKKKIAKFLEMISKQNISRKIIYEPSEKAELLSIIKLDLDVNNALHNQSRGLEGLTDISNKRRIIVNDVYYLLSKNPWLLKEHNKLRRTAHEKLMSFKHTSIGGDIYKRWKYLFSKRCVSQVGSVYNLRSKA